MPTADCFTPRFSGKSQSRSLLQSLRQAVVKQPPPVKTPTQQDIMVAHILDKLKQDDTMKLGRADERRLHYLVRRVVASGTSFAPAELLAAIAYDNRWNTTATGGLLGLRESAAHRMGLTVNDTLDERLSLDQNLKSAVQYLSYMQHRFLVQEDALMAYRAGEDLVKRYILKPASLTPEEQLTIAEARQFARRVGRLAHVFTPKTRPAELARLAKRMGDIDPAFKDAAKNKTFMEELERAYDVLNSPSRVDLPLLASVNYFASQLKGSQDGSPSLTEIEENLNRMKTLLRKFGNREVYALMAFQVGEDLVKEYLLSPQPLSRYKRQRIQKAKDFANAVIDTSTRLREQVPELLQEVGSLDASGGSRRSVDKKAYDLVLLAALTGIIATMAVNQLVKPVSPSSNPALPPAMVQVVPAAPASTYQVNPGDPLLVPPASIAIADSSTAPMTIVTQPSPLELVSENVNQMSPAQIDGTIEYVVVRGDTLGEIATRFNTTVDAIMRANEGLILDEDEIETGWHILIPVTQGSGYQVLVYPPQPPSVTEANNGVTVQAPEASQANPFIMMPGAPSQEIQVEAAPDSVTAPVAPQEITVAPEAATQADPSQSILPAQTVENPATGGAPAEIPAMQMAIVDPLPASSRELLSRNGLGGNSNAEIADSILGRWTSYNSTENPFPEELKAALIPVTFRDAGQVSDMAARYGIPEAAIYELNDITPEKVSGASGYLPVLSIFVQDAELQPPPAAEVQRAQVAPMAGSQSNISDMDTLVAPLPFQDYPYNASLPITESDFNQLKALAQRQNVDPLWLLSIFLHETAYNPTADGPYFNPNKANSVGCVGSIQWCAPSEQWKGGLTFAEQLPHIEERMEHWFKSYRAPQTAVDYYLMVFTPAYINETGNIGDLNGDSTKQAVYRSNSGADLDRDGDISALELQRLIAGRYDTMRSMYPENLSQAPAETVSEPVASSADPVISVVGPSGTMENNNTVSVEPAYNTQNPDEATIMLSQGQQTQTSMSAVPGFQSLPSFQYFPLSDYASTGTGFAAGVGYQAGGHTAIDFFENQRNDAPAEFIAPLPGKVVHTGALFLDNENHDIGRGNAVVVDVGDMPDGRDIFVVYSHGNFPDGIYVEPGQTVEAGQSLGRMGEDGYGINGAGEHTKIHHLHFEVVVGSFTGDWQNPFGPGSVFVDPAPFMAEAPDAPENFLQWVQNQYGTRQPAEINPSTLPTQ